MFGVTMTTLPLLVVAISLVRPGLLPASVTEVCATYIMWNSYLVCWAMFLIPFLITPGLSYTRVVVCYYGWVTFVRPQAQKCACAAACPLLVSLSPLPRGGIHIYNFFPPC